MHSHANRAGYLDLEGCTIVDLLPRYVLILPEIYTLPL